MLIPSTPATLVEIETALREILSDGAARDGEELVRELGARGLDLGADPEATIEDLLGYPDEGGLLQLVFSILDGRWVLLPALLRGTIATHRLTASEVAHDYLELVPDFESVSMLTDDPIYRTLADGSPLTQVLTGFDDELIAARGIDPQQVGEAIWLLEPGTLGGLGAAAGDLVGLTTRDQGFDLSIVDEPDLEAGGLGARLAAVLAEHDDKPQFLHNVCWQLCVDSADLWVSPKAPLLEAIETAGLPLQGEMIGPCGFDFDRWRADAQLERVVSTYRLETDEALAVLLLSLTFRDVAELMEHVLDAEDSDAAIDKLLGPDAQTPDASDGTLATTQEALRFLGSPDVAEALLAETIGAGRDDAAALGVFAETLEPQAPRSARANLRWLRGKAHERCGHVLAAEEAFEAALALDGSCVVALLDLARFASDRGDAERGLSLLRRADIDDEDSLVVLLQHFRPVERSDIGRNDRCWCGSGRKYKICHRNREMLPLEERAAWLYQKAGTYVGDGPWRDRMIDLATLRAEHSMEPDALWQSLDDPLVADTLMFEGGAFEGFLHERGVLLPEDERLLAEQWLLAERSVHEIESVRPGEGFTARDVRTGDRHEVRERTASRTLVAGTLYCARLVPAGDTIQCFGGMEPVALHDRDPLVALLDSEPEPDDVVAFLTRRFAPPTLQNTQGEPLVFCETVLRSSDPSGLGDHLDSTYQRHQGEQQWHEDVMVLGVPRVRATFTLEGDELLVETNSERRMEEVLAALTGLDLEPVSESRSPATDIREAMSRAPRSSIETPDLDDPAVATEVAAAVADMIRQHEAAWLDESIPALAGVTPREAAADPTRRPDLERLLDSFPTTSPDDFTAMSAERLRGALGLG